MGNCCSGGPNGQQTPDELDLNRLAPTTPADRIFDENADGQAEVTTHSAAQKNHNVHSANMNVSQEIR